jgi:hypothetical protein
MKSHTQHNTIDHLLSSIKSYALEGNNDKFNDGTIYNLDGVQGLVKLDLVVEGTTAYLTRLTGDCEGVLEWDRKLLIGADLLTLFNVPQSVINEAFEGLNANGFYLKQNTFKNQKGSYIKTTSILMWREKGKRIVEFIWKA